MVNQEKFNIYLAISGIGKAFAVYALSKIIGKVDNLTSSIQDLYQKLGDKFKEYGFNLMTKLKSEWAYDWMGFEDKHKIHFEEPKTFGYRADIDQLAHYTLKLLTDDTLREQMGQAAAEHTLKNFHYKVVAQKMMDLIQEHVLNKS